jgi:hypothetical protein
MGRLVLALLFAMASVAHAQPAYPFGPPPAKPPWHERSFFGGGFFVGQSKTWTHGAITFEGGGRLPQIREPYGIRARAFLTIVGGTVQSDWSGDFTRFGAGVEALACSGNLCGVLDVDVGWQHATLKDGTILEGDRSGPFVGPRIGVEAGGQRVRVRIMLERYQWKIHREPSEWLGNGGFSFGVIARL